MFKPIAAFALAAGIAFAANAETITIVYIDCPKSHPSAPSVRHGGHRHAGHAGRLPHSGPAGRHHHRFAHRHRRVRYVCLCAVAPDGPGESGAAGGGVTFGETSALYGLNLASPASGGGAGGVSAGGGDASPGETSPTDPGTTEAAPPIDPIGPLGPLGPLGPIGPIGPAGPIDPAPVDPVAPIDPGPPDPPNPAAAPEPSTWLLLGLGAGALMVRKALRSRSLTLRRARTGLARAKFLPQSFRKALRPSSP